MQNIDVLGLQSTWLEMILAIIGLFTFVYFIIRVLIVKTENSLALRNVVRNTRRSIITIIAVGSALAGNILLGNYFLDLYEGLRETTIRSQLGHIIIMKEGFFEEGHASPGDYLFENYEDIKSILLADNEIKEKIQFITAEVNFNGLVTDSMGKKSINFLGSGGEPEHNGTMGLDTNNGDSFNPDADDEIMLGNGLAKQLNVKNGDYVTILTTTPDGSINVLDAKLIGIINTFFRDYGNVLLKTSVAFSQSLLDVQGINKLVIMLNDTRDTEYIYTTIRAIVNANPKWELRTYRWEELTEYYLQVRQLFNNIYTVVSTILFVLVIFLVLNTITMSVYERFSEFGTLRSIGLKKHNLISLVLIEGTYLAIFGMFFGMIIVYTVGTIVELFEITIAPPPGSTRPIPLNLKIKANYDYYFLIIKSMFICFGAVMIASLLPAGKAAKLKIVDCIRENQ